jgi:1-aminocyclopropane-1-carboxylate deaminase/D-cysteine desulfhydrase-like pyridoxal-dependent ACC family enzyme
MLVNIFDVPVELLTDELCKQKEVSLSVLRLDTIHPVVSGNKLFKLHYFLQEAIASHHKTIITFGGAYSNHLVATAFACKEYNVKAIGIVRGEAPPLLSSTLIECRTYGMQLEFISRATYHQKDDPSFLSGIREKYGDCIIIPEGGYHPLGAKGASLINGLFKPGQYSHIACACGTATTLAGLLLAANDQQIIAVPVLKGMADIHRRIDFLCEGQWPKNDLEIFNNFHFGGYAKKTPALIDFMNRLWQQHGLATDFVYTAKLFFAIFNAIENNYFPAGSHVLCLHTGGLQGNNSLPAGTLLF